MSAWCEWWSPESSASQVVVMDSVAASVGVCGDCVLDLAPELRHCGLTCPLSVLDLQARARYGSGARARYPRVLRVGVPTH